MFRIIYWHLLGVYCNGPNLNQWTRGYKRNKGHVVGTRFIIWWYWKGYHRIEYEIHQQQFNIDVNYRYCARVWFHKHSKNMLKCRWRGGQKLIKVMWSPKGMRKVWFKDLMESWKYVFWMVQGFCKRLMTLPWYCPPLFVSQLPGSKFHFHFHECIAWAQETCQRPLDVSTLNMSREDGSLFWRERECVCNINLHAQCIHIIYT